MTAVLDQRLSIPYNSKLSWVKKELTIKQKQLSQLATPGELIAYEIQDGKILVPKAWGLTNQKKLGVKDIQDNQFVAETVNCPIVIETLRPHQTEALKAICTEFTSNPLGGGGVLVLPCGYGKTVTALCVAAQMKVKCLLVTHTAVLAKQWRESIMQYSPSAVIGQIVQDKFEVEGCTHVIGSLQTLAKRDYSEQMRSAGFGLLCVDEGHHISAVCMSNAVSMVGCRYRLCLSATPQRADGLSPFLTMAFGPTLYEVKRPPSQDLRVYCVHLDDGPIMTMHTRGRNPCVNISGMVNLLTKTSLRAQQRQHICLTWIQLALNMGRHILVIGDRIQLLKNLEEMVRPHCTTGFLIGSAKQAEREAAKTANVIFGSYSCCAEGLDLKSLDTLILLTPRSGVNCIEQCVGRLLRDGGRFPLVIDIVDNEPTFLGMSRKRIKLFKKMGAQITHYNERKEIMSQQFLC